MGFPYEERAGGGKKQMCPRITWESHHSCDLLVGNVCGIMFVMHYGTALTLLLMDEINGFQVSLPILGLGKKINLIDFGSI